LLNNVNVTDVLNQPETTDAVKNHSTSAGIVTEVDILDNEAPSNPRIKLRPEEIAA
jgi:hypothetical protein